MINKCNLCWWDVFLYNPSEIYWNKYKHINDLWDWIPTSFIYQCMECKARVWCHWDSKKPLWTLADKKTRNARNLCHKLLDPLWKIKQSWNYKTWLQWKERKRLYKLLSKHMNIPIEKTHFGMFTIEQCRIAYRFFLNYKKKKNVRITKDK